MGAGGSGTTPAVAATAASQDAQEAREAAPDTSTGQRLKGRHGPSARPQHPQRAGLVGAGHSRRMKFVTVTKAARIKQSTHGTDCLLFEHWRWAPGGQGLTAAPGRLSIGLCTASVDGRRVGHAGDVHHQAVGPLRSGTCAKPAWHPRRRSPSRWESPGLGSSDA